MDCFLYDRDIRHESYFLNFQLFFVNLKENQIPDSVPLN